MAVYNLDLVNVHLGAVGQLAHHGSADGACLVTDIDIGVAGNGSRCHNGLGASGAAAAFGLGRLRLVGGCLVVGVHQGDPAAVVAAPEASVDSLGLENDHGVIHIQLGHHAGADGAGCVTDIDIGVGHLDGGAPHGIQGLSCLGRAQRSNSGAAGLGGVPAGKGLAGVGGDSLDGRRLGAVITLHLVLTHIAAIGIQQDICIVGRRCCGVLAVQVQVGLAQAALDQAGAGGAAHIAPQADGIQEIIAGGLVQNGRAELAGTGGPGGTAVVGEGDQRIKLGLGQRQGIGAGKGIDGSFQRGHMGPHGGICFFFGNGGTLRAGGAVANGPLAVVPVGLLVEALKTLNQCNTSFTGGHGSGGCGQGCGRHKSEHHHQCQKEAEKSLLHGINLLFPII